MTDEQKQQARQARSVYYKKWRANMSNEQRESRNAYSRKWRAANPEKAKAAQERYWARKAAEMQDGNKESDNG